jgi:putative membrane protein
MTGKASDHLANERTFLAWVRTALGLIGLGFVLARMGLFLRQLALTAQGLSTLGAAGASGSVSVAHGLHAGHEFLVSGVIFLVIGAAFCAWSAWNYDRNRRAIDAERFEPEKRSVAVLSIVVVLGGLGLVVLVLWRTLGAEE